MPTKFASQNSPLAVTAAIIASFCISNLFVQYSFDRNVDEAMLLTPFFGFAIGMFFGQLNLIGTWAAVSAGNIMVRLPWAILLTILVWVSYVVGRSHSPYNDDHAMALIAGWYLAFSCLIIQLPLWIASRTFRWRLIAKDSERDPNDLQFNLQHMLTGTVLLCAALALIRGFASIRQVDIGDTLADATQFQLLVFLTAFLLCNLLLVVPCIWAAFHAEFTPQRVAVGIAVVAAVTAMQFGGICAVIGGPGGDEFEWWLFFFAIHLGEMFAVLGCLRIFRDVLGFRLIRLDAFESRVGPVSAVTEIEPANGANG